MWEFWKHCWTWRPGVSWPYLHHGRHREHHHREHHHHFNREYHHGAHHVVHRWMWQRMEKVCWNDENPWMVGKIMGRWMEIYGNSWFYKMLIDVILSERWFDQNRDEDLTINKMGFDQQKWGRHGFARCGAEDKGYKASVGIWVKFGRVKFIN